MEKLPTAHLLNSTWSKAWCLDNLSLIRLNARTGSGFVILLIIMILALLAPQMSQHAQCSGPVPIDLDSANIPPCNIGHMLGTDYLGRDVLSELMWGARASLCVGIVAASAAVAFGSLWGSISALAGGLLDSIMMRIVDGLLAIPNIVLLLALNTLVSTTTLLNTLPAWILSCLRISSYSSGLLPLVTVIFVVSATTWLESARLARAKIIALKTEEYMIAAAALGASYFRILTRHLLPNAASILLVEATLLVSDAILMESGLSYLGLGLGPSTPSWGSMLSSAQLSLNLGNWWAPVMPGILITTTVLAVNLLSEGWLEQN